MTSANPDFSELLQRSEELETLASKIQQDKSARASEEDIRELARRYHEWFSDCTTAIPDDLKPRQIMREGLIDRVAPITPDAVAALQELRDSRIGIAAAGNDIMGTSLAADLRTPWPFDERDIRANARAGAD